MVGLDGAGSDYPARLSGGMAQRAQIARALALDANVLLMDEPFGALDAITKASLQDVLLGVQKQTGATVVFITHDLDEAIYLSDRVLVLAGRPGAITLTATTELPRPRDQFATRELPQYCECGTDWAKRCGPTMASRSRSWAAGMWVPAAVIAGWQLLGSAGLLRYEYLPTPGEVLDRARGPSSPTANWWAPSVTRSVWRWPRRRSR